MAYLTDFMERITELTDIETDVYKRQPPSRSGGPPRRRVKIETECQNRTS